MSNEWIKCSDKLPTEDGEYNVTIIHERDKELRSTSMEFDCYNRKWRNCSYEKVIAWQPLPEPPKEQDDVE